VGAWALDRLRCPACMSRLIVYETGGGDPSLHCTGCGRDHLFLLLHPIAALPRLRRQDDRATLSQDIVVFRSDPKSTRRDRRRTVYLAEEREDFLTSLTATAEKGGNASPWLLDRFIAAIPAPSKNAVVLDAHCGEGAVALALASHGPGVIGTDDRLPALERAVAAGRDAASTALFVEASVLEAPFATRSFEGVWCDDLFAALRPDRQDVFFRQVNRILKIGGVLFLTVPRLAPGVMAGRFALSRWGLGRPVVPGEEVTRAPDGGAVYHVGTTRGMLHHRLTRHGFGVLWLRQTEGKLLVLARKDKNQIERTTNDHGDVRA